MPLPFSNYREGASSAPVETKQMSTTEDSAVDYLEICAEDLHNAMKAGNIKGIAEALRAAFEILESEPHEEGPHA